MKPFWNFNAKQDIGELLLYGVISSESWSDDDVTPKAFKADLDALGDIKTLNIYINSPGGDVFAGSAIYSMLKRHSAKKIVYIDGIAASMASVVAMAGDKIIMPGNAMMMIHNPGTLAFGNANDMRKMADDLDRIAESMITAYRDKTGKSDEDIRAVMDAEIWYTAEEAIAAGWADELEASKKIAACLRDGVYHFGSVQVDPSAFRQFPADKIQTVPDPPVPEAPPKTMGEKPLDIYRAKIMMSERRFKHYAKQTSREN